MKLSTVLTTKRRRWWPRETANQPSVRIFHSFAYLLFHSLTPSLTQFNQNHSCAHSCIHSWVKIIQSITELRTPSLIQSGTNQNQSVSRSGTQSIPPSVGGQGSDLREAVRFRCGDVINDVRFAFNIQLVSWYFEPSKPQRVTSWLVWGCKHTKAERVDT